MSLSSALPSLYAAWMSEALGGSPPPEPHASCHDCAMCPAVDAEAEDTFNPATRCCTHLPVLANFLVGQTLGASTDAVPGRPSLLDRIRRRVAVTPLGLGRSRVAQTLFESAAPAFGKALSLRCPHYLQNAEGTCGLWAHRNAVCSTWFCKHDRGSVGRTFWRRLERLLSEAERSLARWCLLELGLEPSCLAAIVPLDDPQSGELPAADLDEAVPPERYRALWGSWEGREEELYLECAGLVSPLRWSDVEQVGGAPLRLLRALAKSAWQEATDDGLPPVPLGQGTYQVVRRKGETCRVSSYSAYDPLDIPARVLEALSHFDGTLPTPEVLRAVEAELGTPLDERTIRLLLDFDILQPSLPAPRRQRPA